MEIKWRRPGLAGPLLVGVTAFGVYLLTVAPDLTAAHYGGDGGELITAAVTLGVPHPPGYPTYVLLGKLFSFLPLGPVAFRFNLFSAVAVAVAAALVTVVANAVLGGAEVRQPPKAGEPRQWGLRTDWAGVAAGLTFAFTPLVWSQATITEVYGLNLAFLALFLWTLLGRVRPGPLNSRGWAAGLAGLWLGLAISSHLTSLLMLPLALALTPRRGRLLLAAGLLLGLAPLLVIPWLAQSGSPVVWGRPATWPGWWWLVSGQLYRSNTLALPAGQWPARLNAWQAVLFNPLIWLGLPLAVSAGETRNGQRPVYAWLLATAALYAVYAFTYASQDAVVFFLPGLLLLSVLLASGLKRLGWAALLLPGVLLALNFNAQDISDGPTMRAPAENVLWEVPQNAVLLTPGDQTIFALWYFQQVEGQRLDIVLVDQNLFQFDWYREQLGRTYPDLRHLDQDDVPGFLARNRDQRPVCVAPPLARSDQTVCLE
ncbi:MAG: DUF2723 domain-containing protein [Chloroflexi bacterium]|nr:DUF2723 domain-containing protein [Chloroflexota bacterium]MCI0580024.1 DUF2723 domain-containing protein [Chloroflexota bacterium]MCI0646781.1 DUF2723 domain-containing protein [Chloroflexota bacterium]MCI0730191.1 DUF2723 domain-containing protein [Chloroflexota bacterium]